LEGIATPQSQVPVDPPIQVELDSLNVRPRPVHSQKLPEAAGISSTDAEKESARAVAKTVYDYLKAAGWPEPLKGDSGNGYHALYLIDLPNDDASRDLLSRGLRALATQFDQPDVKIDTSVYNASRVVKCYGTTVRKGDCTADRPQRRASLIGNGLGYPKMIVSTELLQALAARAPP